MELLLANLPIFVCFLLGLGLLIVEVFMPGFGLPGISGIILEVVSIVLTYLWHGGLAALGMTLVILAVVAIVISLALRSVNKGRLSKSPIILNDAESAADGYVATRDMEVFLGKESTFPRMCPCAWSAWRAAGWWCAKCAPPNREKPCSPAAGKAGAGK